MNFKLQQTHSKETVDLLWNIMIWILEQMTCLENPVLNMFLTRNDDYSVFSLHFKTFISEGYVWHD